MWSWDWLIHVSARCVWFRHLFTSCWGTALLSQPWTRYAVETKVHQSVLLNFWIEIATSAFTVTVCLICICSELTKLDKHPSWFHHRRTKNAKRDRPKEGGSAQLASQTMPSWDFGRMSIRQENSHTHTFKSLPKLITWLLNSSSWIMKKISLMFKLH